jgi:cysteine desulfurase
MIHLDANASFGTLPGLTDEVCERLGSFSNPSAVHRLGQRARSLVEEARAEVLELVGARAGDQLVFTSGATESNNMAVAQVALKALQEQRQNATALVCSQVEHPAIQEPMAFWEGYGFQTIGIPVEVVSAESERGVVDLLPPETGFVSLMAANNESGEVFPVGSHFEYIREALPGAVLHSDIVQLVGKQDLHWTTLNCDLASLSAHKIGGFSGCGALLVRAGVSADPWVRGGPQEQRRRAGTENLPGIVSFGIAARRTRKELVQRRESMLRGREFLETTLGALPEFRINFREVPQRLPNTSSITVPGVRADDLVVSMDLQGVAISSGAACASGKPQASHVLTAYGLTPQEAKSTIRLSLTGREVQEDLDFVVDRLIQAVKRIKRVASVSC